jgi:FKBP-type peptidyl-prolyl cis-trans isomerase
MGDRHRLRTALSAAAALLLAAGAASAGDRPENEHEKVLYVMGVKAGLSLLEFALSEEEIEPLVMGLRDTALGRELRVNPVAFVRRTNALLGERRPVALEREKKASQEYLKRAAAEEGVVRTESGCLVAHLRAGTGGSPTAVDRVVIRYHGRLRTGTVFDSSVERGAAETVSMARVIPCWREGLVRAKEGGKIRVVCPPEAAFGTQGKPPWVPGEAALDYEIELVEIRR